MFYLIESICFKNKTFFESRIIPYKITYLSLFCCVIPFIDPNKPKLMLRNLLTVLLFIVFYFSSYSQQTAVFTNDLVQFNQAISLYENNQFLAAQALFTAIKEHEVDETVKSDCAYYIANCAVRLNQQDADQLMEQFVENYPTSIKRNSAFINVATFYFENGKYSHARKWFDKVDETSLSRGALEKFQFNNGYAFFKNKRHNEAKKYFNKVSNSNTYGAQAKYYLGFIAYEGDDYEEAAELFEEVKEEERYSKDLSYYQADMNFKLGKFQKAIDLGKEQFEQSPPKEKSELSKIIGESYFNLQKYEDAIPYLVQYKGKKGRWNNTDYYQLGYAHYKQNDYENAIHEFNKIIGGDNGVAQNAYYHLAESYLKVDKKQQALNAFKNASEMDYSLEIQEDAWFNYAKLSYEIGNSYQSVPEVLMSFITQYQKNENNESLKDLLIDSYVTSKNYKAAVELLENNKSFHNKLAYQKVAFFRGIEIYIEGDYNEAIIYFEKSLKEPHDAIFKARATYWKAESDYQLSNFTESLIGYKQFLQFPKATETPEFSNSSYNLAYNEFKLKNYTEAIDRFTFFVASNTSNNAAKKDAYLRLGDSYFVSSKYWPAMDSYNKAIELGSLDLDYATFQKAISYGFVDRTEKKIEELANFSNTFPKSMYRDDALYELGNTFVSQNNNNNAIEAYNQLVQELPGSSYVSKALLKKALILDNTGKSNEALTLFKKVANDFPSTPEALQAVASAKLIYIDQGKVNEYGNWVRTLDFVEVVDSELDDATFQAAEQPYLEHKTPQAITRFEEYINQFPKGKHALHAHFYLAQMYYSEDKKEKAISHYSYVADIDRNEFTEQALVRISQLYLNEKEPQNAIEYLSRLETEADFPQNVTFARINSMKANYELKNYYEAEVYADKVLLLEKIDSAIKSEAQLIIARSAMKTGNEEKAKSAYEEVSKIAAGILAAEAKYYNAYFKNKGEDFAGSNEVIQVLARDFSGYKLYGAKGLVLMADNFYQLEDAFQATYILENVISNFSEYPEVTEEAKEKLAIIKKAEAKTNSSIEIEDEN
jgi:TolA-binding protein